MKNLYMRIIALLSICTLLLTLIGCSSAGEAKADKTSTPKQEEMKELKISVFDRSATDYIADDNFQTKWIQENFGDPNNIKVTFVPIPRFEEVDILNVLMASNQAPDICFTYSGDIVKNYALNGSITELDELLATKGTKVAEYFGEDLLSRGRWNDIQYALPAKRIHTAAVSTFIRKDWLDKLNLPEPTTKEEYFDTLVAFKENDPGNLGENNLPFSFRIDSNNMLWSVYTLIYGFLEPMTDEERTVLPFWLWPGYKEAMRYLNKMYNAGLIDKEFVSNIDGKQQTMNIIEGKVGSFINSFDLPYRTPDGFARLLKDAVPDGEIVPIDPFVNYEGKTPKNIYDAGGFYIFIPKSSKMSEEAMKYLEWMTDPEVIFFLQHGEKGVHYMNEQNGIPIDVVPMEEVPADKKANFVDLAIIANGNEYGDEKKNIEAASFAYPGYEELFVRTYEIAVKDGAAGLDTYVDPSSPYSADLNKKSVEMFVATIICPSASFDEVYDSLVDEYLQMGGQQIIDEKTAAYAQQVSEQSE